MSGTEFANEGVLRGVAKLLGLPDVAALSEVKPSGLWRLTQRELLDVAKTLGLSKVSRLKKEALLARVWEELAQKGAGAGVMLVPDGPTGVAPPVSNGTAHVAPELADVVQAKAPSAPAAPGPVPSPAAPTPQEARETPPGAARKFEVGEGAEIDLAALRAESEATIPWGYGRDRITAMPVDPDRLYAYWEVTDEAVSKARAGLGQGGPGAYLCLRVYDITGRIFDGTNAHGYSDHGMDRAQRQWFFHVGKPTSEAVIDVGLKSHEGYFVKIARSGRVTFPRREPVHGGEPEWMTVRVSTGNVEGTGQGYAITGAENGGGGAWNTDGGFRGGHDPYFPEGFAHLRHLLWGGRVEGESFETHYLRWEEIAETEIDAEVVRSWSWTGDVESESWSAGPFSYPVAAPVPVRETYGGPARVFRSGSRTHVVWGPWQVVIKGIGAHADREVLGQWEIYRSWSVEGWKPVPGSSVRLVGGKLLAQGASELRLGGSELRLGGASERFRIGASELRLGGASERSFIAASELRLGGASERVWGGASELRFQGASERRLGGASELRLGGASEARWGGGSEGRLGGGSEARLGGGSEARLEGRSEERSEERLKERPFVPSGNWPDVGPGPGK